MPEKTITFADLTAGDRFTAFEKLWTKLDHRTARQHDSASLLLGERGYGYVGDAICTFERGDEVTFVPPVEPVYLEDRATGEAITPLASRQFEAVSVAAAFYSGGFQREVRADIAPFSTPEMIADGRRHREPTAREAAAERTEAMRTSTDSREIAKAKGLKLWNGGGNGVVRKDEARKHGHHHESSVKVYACAKSRAELLRMIATYQGLPGPERLVVGFPNHVKTHWSEGAWGTPMAGIEPEPGLWLQWKDMEAPVRVWPKEKAE